MVQEVKANVFTNSTRMTAVSIAFIHTGIQGMRNLFNIIYKGKQSVPTYFSIQPATVIIQ
jgi:hypothetical protein